MAMVRNQPRDGIHLRNDRCVLCGWYTKRCCPVPDLTDELLCVECGNTGVCELCTYNADDGSRRCGQCDLRAGAPALLIKINAFIEWYDLCDRLDLFQLCGNFTSRKQILREVIRRWVVVALVQQWLRRMVNRCLSNTVHQPA